MITLQVTLQVKTNARQEMVRITRQVAKVIEDAGWERGLCTVFVPHTTAGVTINENADPDVVRDILYTLERVVPTSDPAYRHSEGNSAAHVKASMMGFSQSMIVEKGKLMLGRWQEIYFCEFDGPRQRELFVKFSPSR